MYTYIYITKINRYLYTNILWSIDSIQTNIYNKYIRPRYNIGFRCFDTVHFANSRDSQFEYLWMIRLGVYYIL